MAEKQDKVPVAAWRMRYQSEPGMINHYPWSYFDSERPANRPKHPGHEYEDLVKRCDHLAEVARLRAESEKLAEALSKINNFDPVHHGETRDEWGEAWSFGKCKELAEVALTAYEASKGDE